MSSTRGKTIKNDVYLTPPLLAVEILRRVSFRPTDHYLDPAFGSGAFFNNVDLPAKQKQFAEINQGVDYLKTEFEPQDVIITNPPFSLAESFLRKSFTELRPDGTLIYLLRTNYFGSLKRRPFFEKFGTPNKLANLVPRPSFKSDTISGRGRTDSCEYSLFIWDRGGRYLDDAISNLYWR